jgi:hypothetical protein
MTEYNLNNLVARIKKYKIEYILLMLIGLFMDLFVRYTGLSYYKSEEHTYSNFRRKLYEMTSGCFIRSDNIYLQKISHFVKGEKYVVQMSDEENTKFRKECITTKWNMIHFASHLIIVFIFPYFYREIFTVSFLYEIYEYYVFKCHDISDIAYNVAGLYLGYNLRKWYDKMNHK